MAAKKCFICGVGLNKSNNIPEHIFLKSLGDKKPKFNLICQQYNNDLGTIIDQPFVKTFKPLYQTVSGKSERIKMTFTDGREYFVHIKNEIIEEGKPYIAVNPVIVNNDSQFQAKFLDIDQANRFLDKKKLRLQKRGIKANLSLNHKLEDPSKTGATFTLTPKIDYRYFVLELVKMQTEYLHSINFTSADKFLYGDLILRIILNHSRQADTILPVLDPWCKNMFQKIILPFGFNNRPKSYTPQKGRSTCKIIPIPGYLSTTPTLFLYYSLFGKLNVWFPILTSKNLVNLLGPGALQIVPFSITDFKLFFVQFFGSITRTHFIPKLVL